MEKGEDPVQGEFFTGEDEVASPQGPDVAPLYPAGMEFFGKGAGGVDDHRGFHKGGDPGFGILEFHPLDLPPEVPLHGPGTDIVQGVPPHGPAVLDQPQHQAGVIHLGIHESQAQF